MHEMPFCLSRYRVEKVAAAQICNPQSEIGLAFPFATAHRRVGDPKSEISTGPHPPDCGIRSAEYQVENPQSAIGNAARLCFSRSTSGGCPALRRGGVTQMATLSSRGSHGQDADATTGEEGVILIFLSALSALSAVSHPRPE